MTPEERWDRIREYVVERLRAEVEPLARGGQAEIAKQLDTSGAHLSNVLAPEHPARPGEVFCRKAAARWGMSYAELEALACGEPTPAEQFLRRVIEEAMQRRPQPPPASDPIPTAEPKELPAPQIVKPKHRKRG